MIWLLLLFGVLVIWGIAHSAKAKKSSPPEVKFTVSETRGYNVDDALGRTRRHEWSPRFSPDTALESLLHQGEVWEKPVEDAPKYGNDGDGHWADVTWGKHDEVWSDVGHVPSDGGEFKQFLIEFRRIVESSAPTVERIKRCEELCESSVKYTEFADKLGEEFPYSWFSSQIAVIPSVGQGTAQKFFDAGFIDLKAIELASDQELEAVHGVGPGTVRQIRMFFNSEPEKGSRRRFRDMDTDAEAGEHQPGRGGGDP